MAERAGSPSPAPSRHRQLNDYLFVSQIGKGKLGEVFLYRDRKYGGRDVVVKAIKRRTPQDKLKLLRKSRQQHAAIKASGNAPMSSTEHSFRKEVAVMRKCRHQNVVQFLETIDVAAMDRLYVVMEYLDGGPVQWTTKTHQPTLTLDQTRRIIRDLVVGLEYLHYLGIIHRDIKPANLVWTRDRRTIKIIDFGVSHMQITSAPPEKIDEEEDWALFPETDLRRTSGTPSFLAPEVVWFSGTAAEPPSISVSGSLDSTQTLHDPLTNPSLSLPTSRPTITKAIDVWSLGVTFYCLLFGRLPFNVPDSQNENVHHSEYSLYREICTQDWAVEQTMGSDKVPTGGRNPERREVDGSAVISILQGLLEKDPTRRISLADLKRQPWLLRGIHKPSEWVRVTTPGPRGPTVALNQQHWFRRVGQTALSIIGRNQ